MHLFDLFIANPPTASGNQYADTRRAANQAGRADSMMLLLRARLGYGLVGGRSGRVLVAPCFDAPPTRWQCALLGEQKKQPWLVPLKQPGFNPNGLGQRIPAGVAPYHRTDFGPKPAVYPTQKGYQTRGGRPLWED
jgi:hypothetical protein